MNEVLEKIQPMKFAGTFYPKDPSELQKFISSHEAPQPLFPNLPKIFVMPHAAYRFSGEVAGQVASDLRDVKNEEIRRVVILSPSHFHTFNGIAKPTMTSFDTPLGPISLELSALKRISKLDIIKEVPEVFDNEYGLEVIYPWVKANLPNAQIAPFVIGTISEKQLKTFIRTLWGNSRTIFIISTDLSHFKNASECEKTDLETASHIETYNSEAITSEAACGYHILKAVVSFAKEHSMRATRIALSNSAKISENQERVVGYGGWAFHVKHQVALSEDQTNILYNIAAGGIASKLNLPFEQKYIASNVPCSLDTKIPCFVSLELKDQPRGSIGSLSTQQSLAKNVHDNAIKAAFWDRRFSEIQPDEFNELECEIALVSHPIPLAANSKDELISKIKQNTDGLILTYGNQRVTLLPKVWEKYPEPEQFINELFLKCNLPDNFWSDDLEFQTYYTERLAQRRLAEA